MKRKKTDTVYDVNQFPHRGIINEIADELGRTPTTISRMKREGNPFVLKLIKEKKAEREAKARRGELATEKYSSANLQTA